MMNEFISDVSSYTPQQHLHLLIYLCDCVFIIETQDGNATPINFYTVGQ